MAEFNPYKLEEEKWTPNNVYEILPPNAVSWSDYEFGQGTDNVDQEAANKSLIDGFVDFFKEIFSTAGKILGGAVELGGAVLGGFVNGVVSLIGGIARAVGSIFGGGNNQNVEPPEPIFNPIKTNLEGAIQPHLDDIAEAKEQISTSLEEQKRISLEIASQGEKLTEAKETAEQGVAEAQEALRQAEELTSALSESDARVDEALASIRDLNLDISDVQSGVQEAVDGLRDSLTEVNLGIAEIMSTQEDLAAGLGEAATQEDYNLLNRILWGEQLDLNEHQAELNQRRREWEEGATLALEHLAEGAASQIKWNKGAEAAMAATAEVDRLQNEAILKIENVAGTNTNTIDALLAAIDSIDKIQALHTQFQEQQIQINEEMDNRSALLEAIQKETVQAISRTIVFDGTNPVYDDYCEVAKSGSTVYFTAKGNWVGNMVAVTKTSYTERLMTSSGGTASNVTLYSSSIFQREIPYQASRRISLGSALQARVDYWVSPGIAKVISASPSHPYLTGPEYVKSTWGEFYRVVIPPSSRNIVVSVTARLRNADKGTQYQLQTRRYDEVGGSTYKQWNRSTTSLGPLFPWESGSAEFKFVADVEGSDKPTEIALFGYSEGNEKQTQVSGFDVRITYVESEVDNQTY